MESHTLETEKKASRTSRAAAVAATAPSQERAELEKELMERYFPLVRSVVNSMMSYLPACADVEELHSAGTMGLISAVRRFDPEKAETFEAYVAMRIRGAILDELRRIDVLPRTTRAKTRRLQQTIEKLEQKLGRTPTEPEIAKALDMSLSEFEKYQFKARPVVLVSLDGARDRQDEDPVNLHETIPDTTQKPCLEKLERSELAQVVAAKIDELPERQRKVLTLYYKEGLRLAEIAELFGVTEARICQIHTQSLATIRKSMAEMR